MSAGTDQKPDGWHPWPLEDSHVLRDALYVGGNAVAIVEAFSDTGPWYANAITPEGERVRLGAGESLEGAVAWAEQTAGHRVKRAPSTAKGRAE
ncbi:hypothetical protein [Methylobacterium sp. E-045]|uniref:hypothetical protein n=1 Tax=Methylobacterium sp. E-045 TaxID=2836575 RepID=UPI001FBA2A30|nr:hypothetical protein [Methylobacterium sp. E-045]MCJ2127686.1 hypothetical protein [Methylobacterium sp. E-045]